MLFEGNSFPKYLKSVSITAMGTAAASTAAEPVKNNASHCYVSVPSYFDLTEVGSAHIISSDSVFE